MRTSASPDAATVEAFLGERLPQHARNIRTHGEQGIDSLILLRFDAPEREASLFAERLLGAPAREGVDPRLGAFGAGLDWWATSLPAGARGGTVTRSGENRTYRLLMAPAPDGRATLWIAAFST